MVSDLRKATEELPGMQKRMLAVTGTAWSPDRMIKAVVGPRGHLLELEIDPRVLRQPNSKALSASIVQTVRVAIEDAGRKSAEVMDEALPSDLRALGDGNVRKYVGGHDADVRERAEDDHG
ncbi:YbaB/EbfC family nucleoid-associated protein [Actinoplanes sp. L3-i22]|uniref:YbaB/EbfC family nucleoid-associated protein n=1 Tax=Actinoplanes sp. L3-i22 TaxID=2836373 RepID=UPI002102C6F0|nr:YbaB/EbfC family nucleoid-associated protein [Actinoplanes sp. L3-i22]